MWSITEADDILQMPCERSDVTSSNVANVRQVGLLIHACADFTLFRMMVKILVKSQLQSLHAQLNDKASLSL